MANFGGGAVLSAFDVHGDTADFLSHMIDASLAPANETKPLVDASIFANSEGFYHLVSCATAIQQSKFRDPNSLEGNDVLTFIWHILSGRECASNTLPTPWAETDRLIAVAKSLADSPPYICSPCSDSGQTDVIAVRKRRRRPRTVLNNTSHYWTEEKEPFEQQARDNNTISEDVGRRPLRVDCADRLDSDLSLNIPYQSPVTSQHVTRTPRSVFKGTCTCLGDTSPSSIEFTDACAWHPSSLPFLPRAISSNKKFPQRKLGGIVSSVPFPPLFYSRFGLIQEETAHEPFWLLIAVTFLIKTNGRVAIPVFHKVRERFPSPRQLADPRNAEELVSMIRHLGLAKNRLKSIQKYATLFLESPPMSGTLHRVRNYDKRDNAFGFGDMFSTGSSNPNLDPFHTADSGIGMASMEAWEIGHMTQGKYTLDSWRIFCRDMLLGRAEDWNGKGREPEFQPEWMRVMPQDKELRAYLRWMWMREGWEWDPVTGERKILCPELQLAVNERRVEYDDRGGLRLLQSPRQTVDA
ncbi:hypothetical protein E4U21_000295 [Claviceps maximensis]|nr:hypothetical protein E4U21_000295 [Claviceps maximensis]